jgi:hypothetical protein
MGTSIGWLEQIEVAETPPLESCVTQNKASVARKARISLKV